MLVEPFPDGFKEMLVLPTGTPAFLARGATHSAKIDHTVSYR
jgi:hypothetical protein